VSCGKRKSSRKVTSRSGLACCVVIFRGSKTATRCEEEEPPKLPNLLKKKSADDGTFCSIGKHATYLHKLRKCLSKAVETDRKLLMLMAQKMAGGRNRRASGEA
jgi:hypothetical protein